MTTLDYFKQQAKLLLKDYNLMKENGFDYSKITFENPEEHFDIDKVLVKANKQKGENFTLMNMQHILAKISDFKDWNDFIHSSEPKQEIGALKLNFYKIGMDLDMLESAYMLVGHELFAEFVDDDYTDQDELDMWKYVIKRLLY